MVNRDMPTTKRPLPIWYGLDERLLLFRYTQGSKLGALILRLGKVRSLTKMVMERRELTSTEVDIGSPIVLGEISNYDSLIIDIADRAGTPSPAHTFMMTVRNFGVAVLTGQMIDELKRAGEVKWAVRRYRVHALMNGDNAALEFTAGTSSLHACRTVMYNARALLHSTYQSQRSSHGEETRDRLP